MKLLIYVLINQYYIIIIMDHIIKLNARGHLMYVDEAILAKSHYFRHILRGDGFQKSLPDDKGAYYVDCDRDVMTELIAYMETGQFKYKGINTKYLQIMLDKYGINREKEKPISNNTNEINIMIDKIVEYIAKNIINDYEEIIVQFVDCNSDEIQIVAVNKESLFRRGKRIILVCKYNNKKYPINKLLLRKDKNMIYSSLEKYKIDKKLYVSRIGGYDDIEIHFNIIPKGNIKIADDVNVINTNEVVDNDSDSNSDSDSDNNHDE